MHHTSRVVAIIGHHEKGCWGSHLNVSLQRAFLFNSWSSSSVNLQILTSSCRLWTAEEFEYVKLWRCESTKMQDSLLHLKIRYVKQASAHLSAGTKGAIPLGDTSAILRSLSSPKLSLAAISWNMNGGKVLRVSVAKKGSLDFWSLVNWCCG